MSERPTPETDALILSKGGFGMTNYEWREHSRKLERERNKAREAAAKWESLFSTMERAGAEQARRADTNREWGLRAERERDEAREALENHTTATIHTCHSECKRPMCVLRRERDQARELCLKLNDLVAYGLGQSGEPCSLDAMRQATAAIQKTKQMGTLPTD